MRITYSALNGLPDATRLEIAAVDLMAECRRDGRGYCVRFGVFLRAACDATRFYGGSFLRWSPERFLVVPARNERTVAVWSN